ncbi:Myb-like domain-containing protein [Mycena venus]|uniref:Myb-like domain-containing protein n=1 Tax=Mycena venus TaxID=2733690 RepID=A0A8H6XM86_9AGAR|nr:Myb-like domain-containing protein [Mycena venus]
MAHKKKRSKKPSSRPSPRRSTRLQGKRPEEHDRSLETQPAANLSEHEESPPWAGITSDGELPADDSSLDGTYSQSPSPEFPENDEEEDRDLSPEPTDEEPDDVLSSQVANVRTPRWQSWQDRYLALAVDQIRPFLLPPSEREEGWNRTAEVLYRDSSAIGPRSTVERTGSACKNRFMKLMKEHKKGECAKFYLPTTHSYKLMTDLQAIMDDYRYSAKEASEESQRKTKVENKAGQQLQDAAMMGLALSEGLIDISKLDGASVREKQGQQKCRRPPLSPSKHHNCARSSDDNLDFEPPPKRRRRRNVIQDVLQRRNEVDNERLNNARSRADQHHNELLNAQNATLHAIVDLTKEMKGLQEDNRTSHAGETSRTAEILAGIIAHKS